MTKPKIVHLSYNENAGGAAIAAKRVAQSLSSLAEDTYFLAVSRSNNPNSTPALGVLKTFFVRKILRQLSRAFSIMASGPRRILSYGLFPTGVYRSVNNLSPDFVFLHWVGGEMISSSDIKKIRGNVICVLHDLWLVNGSEHLFEGAKLRRGIIGRTIDNFLKNKKRRALKSLNPVFVVPSQFLKRKLPDEKWILDRTWVIPIPICPTVWQPYERKLAKNILGINSHSSRIICLCTSGGQDINKGLHLITGIIGALPDVDRRNLTLMTFGDMPRPFEDLPCKWVHLGKWHDVAGLRLVYSAADIVIVPSAFESFGQIAAEAQMMGRPVVAFRNTGAEDIVDHGVTGYLADPKSTESFARGILSVLNATADQYSEMCEAAALRARSHLSPDVIRDKYTIVLHGRHFGPLGPT